MKKLVQEQIALKTTFRGPKDFSTNVWTLLSTINEVVCLYIGVAWVN